MNKLRQSSDGLLVKTYMAIRNDPSYEVGRMLLLGLAVFGFLATLAGGLATFILLIREIF